MKEIVSAAPPPPPLVHNQFESVKELFNKYVVPTYARFDLAFTIDDQTLEDDTEVSYQMSHYYVPEQARGVRFDDPAFGIAWPLPNPIVSERDRQFADFAT